MRAPKTRVEKYYQALYLAEKLWSWVAIVNSEAKNCDETIPYLKSEKEILYYRTMYKKARNRSKRYARWARKMASVALKLKRH